MRRGSAKIEEEFLESTQAVNTSSIDKTKKRKPKKKPHKMQDKKKYAMKRVMTAYNIELPSDSDESSSEDEAITFKATEDHLDCKLF